MSGPAACVLLPETWTAGHLAEFHEWLASWLTPAGDDGWRTPSGGGPITVDVGARESEDADEATGLRRALGYLPGTEIVLAAAVNGPDDHRFLAELAVATARRYDGVIDLDGLLPAGGPDWKERSRATIRALPGRWHEIPYRTAWGTAAAYHVVDPDLLAAWLKHPRFGMVK
jgi:hypothetical protein